jgi:hypothetical protein
MGFDDHAVGCQSFRNRWPAVCSLDQSCRGAPLEQTSGLDEKITQLKGDRRQVTAVDDKIRLLEVFGRTGVGLYL